MSASLQAVRELLEQRFPDALPVRHGTVEGVPTGIGALDRVLPGSGLPRGRLSVWAPGGGATAVLRGACDAVVARGERAAWVDGARQVSGAHWRGGPLLFRPAGTREALACAEELLRCGGFGMVVLSGVARLEETGVRLARAAREGGGAFVALSGAVPVAALRLSSRILPEGYRWRLGPHGEPVEVEAVMVRVMAAGLGVQARAEFKLSVMQHEVRLSLDPAAYDRRGAVRGRST